MKKLFALLLVLAMVLALIPASAELKVGTYDPASEEGGQEDTGS